MRDDSADPFVDFDLRIAPGSGLRRLFKPQARFLIDTAEPFLPLPADQAAPLFEWGLNWCLATRPLGFLVLHAAVVARDDAAIVMPGIPGAGKSTLCAALCFLKGWRLLSDELALIEPERSLLRPHPRPISLKNASIDIVRGFPGARIGAPYHDTRKGVVSHTAAPATSIAAADRPARCRWIVFPRFSPGAAPERVEISRAEAFVLISQQSFNKERMGAAGFAALCEALDGAHCHEITYGSTEAALALIDEICAP